MLTTIVTVLILFWETVNYTYYTNYTIYANKLLAIPTTLTISMIFSILILATLK